MLQNCRRYPLPNDKVIANHRHLFLPLAPGAVFRVQHQKPKPRPRLMSVALRHYALTATSASRGAVRDVDAVENALAMAGAKLALGAAKEKAAK